jgi:sulfatase maturation enzyme AslB (radical SAM superfamily)
MKLRSLSLILTEDCNFDCGYCYKSKRSSYMSWDTIEKSLSFFLPYMEYGAYVIFYGGEPLLALDQIKKSVPFVKHLAGQLGKTAHFSMTTNGSLLTGDAIRFLAENEFYVVLSFDGLAQEIHRQKSSFSKVVRAMDVLLNESRIQLDISSVFTPSSVRYFADSLHYLMNKGAPRIQFSLSVHRPWDPESLRILTNNLQRLVEISAEHYGRTGRIPIDNFANYRKIIFRCAAAQDRLAITPEGEIWGCDLFAECARQSDLLDGLNRSFHAHLDDFISSHRSLYPEMSWSYSNLSTDNFSTTEIQCFLCGYLSECRICPMEAMFSGLPLGKVPDYLCEIQRIKIKAKRSFYRSIESIPMRH